MAHKSPRDRLKMMTQQQLEEGLFEIALERLLAEAAQEAGIPELDGIHVPDRSHGEGRLIYDKFDSRPR
jgi:hypothetical protein